jgi:hypothetical protein
MAYGSWITPGKWYGYMPPISLWSFIFTTGAFVIYLKRKDMKSAVRIDAGS